MSILRVTLPGRRNADSAAPTAQIAVAAVAGGVAIGVLITATWNQRRPADTYIGQSPGTVDVQREPASGEPTFNAKLSGPGATRLAAAVDALRIQADVPYSCPTGRLTTTTLTFHPNRQVITVTLLNGCPYGPFLTAGGATYTLASDGTIETTLSSVLPSLPNR